ncbi:MAG: hypothetical protein LQ340_000475 [Diploschistes diacapsis]|nr:MAG: hypothetical protein LQ340_000475 [Diploschistes diacapsis]
MALSSSYVPAWRRLGLKLKREEEGTQTPDGQPIPHLESTEPAAKKRKLSPSPSTNNVAPNRASSAGGSHGAKKAEGSKARDIPTTPTKPGADGPAPTQAPRGEAGAGSSRRKSVSFAADTKREDGDSKRLAREAQASMLAREGGVERADVEAAGEQLEGIFAGLHEEAPAKEKQKKKKEKKEKERKGKAKRDQQGGGNELENDAAKKKREAVLQYLAAHHAHPSTWKFNKNLQTGLLKSAFDTAKIPPSYDDALRGYVAGLQGGRLREKLHDEAREIARVESPAADEAAVDVEDREGYESVKAMRARVERAKVVSRGVEDSYSRFKDKPVVAGGARAGGDQAERERGEGEKKEATRQTNGGEERKKKKRKRVRKRRTDISIRAAAAAAAAIAIAIAMVARTLGKDGDSASNRNTNNWRDAGDKRSDNASRQKLLPPKGAAARACALVQAWGSGDQVRTTTAMKQVKAQVKEMGGLMCRDASSGSEPPGSNTDHGLPRPEPGTLGGPVGGAGSVRASTGRCVDGAKGREREREQLQAGLRMARIAWMVRFDAWKHVPKKRGKMCVGPGWGNNNRFLGKKKHA